MTTIRKFCCNDFLRFASVNLDHFPSSGIPINVTISMSHYMKWLVKWPNYSHVAIAPGNQIMGYIIGGLKVEEGLAENYWHGLAIFLDVATEYRRQKLGTRLMRLFEKQMVERMLSTKRDAHYYMFLYVSVFNTLALQFFTKIGYKVVTIIRNFYSQKYPDVFEMNKEIAEERLPSVIRRQFALCRFCKEAKSETCSYVCLPHIV